MVRSNSAVLMSVIAIGVITIPLDSSKITPILFFMLSIYMLAVIFYDKDNLERKNKNDEL